MKTDQAGELKQAGESDQVVVSEESNENPIQTTGTTDSTVQALLLALATTPAAASTPAAVPEATGSVEGFVQEEAPALLQEEGTSSVAALAGAVVVKTAPVEGETPALSTPPLRTSSLLPESAPSAASVSASGLQGENMAQPEESFTLHDVPVSSQTVSKDTVQKNEMPPQSLVPAQGQPATSEAAPAAVLQPAARPVDLESVQPPVREDVRQAVQARSEPLPDQTQSVKLPASDEPTVTAVAWQSFSEEQQSQNGSDLSDQERRDRQGESVFPTGGGSASGQAPAPASYAGVSSVVGDSKTAIIGQPAASTHQAPQPATLHPVQATDWMPAEGPNHTRSVVLEVAQADLGRVNIRVAVNQDMVHTYFTSDRSDIGQFLVNGQDKLQAALQNAGLDMGQFRVDIDHQSAGRSFQQQTPQGQNLWHASSQSAGSQGQGNEASHAGSSHRSGMLNLVA